MIFLSQWHVLSMQLHVSTLAHYKWYIHPLFISFRACSTHRCPVTLCLSFWTVKYQNTFWCFTHQTRSSESMVASRWPIGRFPELLLRISPIYYSSETLACWPSCTYLMSVPSIHWGYHSPLGSPLPLLSSESAWKHNLSFIMRPILFVPLLLCMKLQCCMLSKARKKAFYILYPVF